MEKGNLYNLALTYLGKPEYEADTAESEVVERVAQQCIALALDAHPWTFAKRRAVLTLDEQEGRAELPQDCLRLQKVYAQRFELIGRDLHVRGSYDSVTIDYTTDEYAKKVYTPAGHPLFDEAVVLLMAAKMAPRVTSDFSLAAAMEQRAQAALSRARLNDARQWASNDQHPSARTVDVYFGCGEHYLN